MKIDIEAIKGWYQNECIDDGTGLQQGITGAKWDMSGRNPMSNHLKYTAIDKKRRLGLRG